MTPVSLCVLYAIISVVTGCILVYQLFAKFLEFWRDNLYEEFTVSVPVSIVFVFSTGMFVFHILLYFQLN